MAIVSLDDYVGSQKQLLFWEKLNTITTVAGAYFTMFDQPSQPPAGTLGGSSTAAGVVPTGATAGYATIGAYQANAKGYLSRLYLSLSLAGRLALYDRLFVAGAYNFNANTTLSGQPSYSTRLPGGSFIGTEIWVEQVTAATGNQAVTVTYTDQDGNPGATTGAVGIGAAPTIRRCWKLPLAAGDTGVQTIESVVGTVASAGTFNVMVLRPLGEYPITSNNQDVVLDLLSTGLPEIPSGAALYGLINMQGASAPTVKAWFEIANK